MPAAVAIPAIASVAGAGISAYSSHKAGKAQEKSTDKALAFEREKEAARKASYEAAMADYRKERDAWMNQRNALLSRYGFSVPSTPGIASTPSLPGRVPMQAPQMAAPMRAPMQTAVPGSIKSMIQPGPQELSAWNDWEARGLRV